MGDTILFVGKSEAAIKPLKRRLRRAGFDHVVVHAADEEKLAEHVEQSPALIVVDGVSPEDEGRHVCKRLRAMTNAPIIALCEGGEGDVNERVACLEAGADDSLLKPIDPKLFVARVRAHLRRAHKEAAGEASQGALEVGDLRVDLRRRMVTLRGEPVELTPKEFDLLAALAENAGCPVSSADLLKEIWGYEACCRTRTLDVHISRLRSKLEPAPDDPRLIVTVRCFGYKLVPPG